MQQAKTIADLPNIQGKRVIMRVDYNVPLSPYQGLDSPRSINDPKRIDASIPTIEKLLSMGVSIVLMSHLGRPDGQPNPKYSLTPICEYLSKALSQEIKWTDDCVSDEALTMAKGLQPGQVMLLENLRFHAAEEANDKAFSQKLASLGDIYINDAFGAVHRAHASTAGITEHISLKACGLLVEKEIKELGHLLDKPERPFVSIVGGAKVSSKIDILRSLIEKSDVLLIGGGMAYTFMYAQGGQIGQSICEPDKVSLVHELLEMADKKGTAIILPMDNLCVKNLNDKNEEPIICKAGQIPANYEGLDIGPESIRYFAEQIGQARSILWNGPVGMFEDSRFAHGSQGVAKAMSERTKVGAYTVIGGGDSASAVNKFGFNDSDFSHISTGGGASLEFLAGVDLPGIAALRG